MKKSNIALSLVLSVPLIFISCGTSGTLDVGHGGGYLSAAVYAADLDGVDVNLQQFGRASDIAYALLSGDLDLGFAETDKLSAFSEMSGFNELAAVGVISYPYGATLVLRKGLTNRLSELDGLTVAASSPDCELLGEFIADAERLGADLYGVEYEYMAFEAMLPALTAGTVDAAVIKGSYSAVALHEGHSILYQNWEMRAGDECCPAIADQAALILFARREKLEESKQFVDALLTTREFSPDELRQAVADNTAIPFELLQGQPVPEFSAADDELINTLIRSANNHIRG